MLRQSYFFFREGGLSVLFQTLNNLGWKRSQEVFSPSPGPKQGWPESQVRLFRILSLWAFSSAKVLLSNLCFYIKFSVLKLLSIEFCPFDVHTPLRKAWFNLLARQNQPACSASSHLAWSSLHHLSAFLLNWLPFITFPLCWGCRSGHTLEICPHKCYVEGSNCFGQPAGCYCTSCDTGHDQTSLLP